MNVIPIYELFVYNFRSGISIHAIMIFLNFNHGYPWVSNVRKNFRIKGIHGYIYELIKIMLA